MFSNSSEMLDFQASTCQQCKHYTLSKQSDTYGCPVTDYCVLAESNEELFDRLFFKDGGCQMFVYTRDPAQVGLFEREDDGR